MMEHAQIALRKFDDNGAVEASITVAGAQVAAMGDSLKNALQMLTDALHENDQPLWIAEEPRLEAGEFFITRGDGVQERCRYSGASVTIAMPKLADSVKQEIRDRVDAEKSL